MSEVIVLLVASSSINTILEESNLEILPKKNDPVHDQQNGKPAAF